MRKQILESGPPATMPAQRWLNLEELADVQVTSEDPAHPVENVFAVDNASPWRAAGPGPQTIRLNFVRPQTIEAIRLEFSESERERTQEFALSYWPEGDPGAAREIVRQQWNFSPNGSTRQTESYTVNLKNVKALQLTIDPDRGQNRCAATLDRFLIA